MVNNSCLSKWSTRSITFLWSKFRVCVLFETNKVVYHGYVESIWSVLLRHLRNSLCTRKVYVTFSKAIGTILRELSFSTPLTCKLRVSRKNWATKYQRTSETPTDLICFCIVSDHCARVNNYSIRFLNYCQDESCWFTLTNQVSSKLVTHYFRTVL